MTAARSTSPPIPASSSTNSSIRRRARQLAVARSGAGLAHLHLRRGRAQRRHAIGTPVATMAIRGTVGGVTTANDGTVNFYVSQSATGAVILDSRGTIIANVVQDGPMIVVRPVGPLQVLAEEVQKIAGATGARTRGASADRQHQGGRRSTVAAILSAAEPEQSEPAVDATSRTRSSRSICITQPTTRTTAIRRAAPPAPSTRRQFISHRPIPTIRTYPPSSPICCRPTCRR